MVFTTTQRDTRMTHDKWVKLKRAEALATANGMRSGQLGVIEGSRRLVALAESVDLPRHEALFMPFVAIESQTDHLPIGEQEQFWAPDALALKRDQVAAAETLHRADALSACAELIAGLDQDA